MTAVIAYGCAFGLVTAFDRIRRLTLVSFTGATIGLGTVILLVLIVIDYKV